MSSFGDCNDNDYHWNSYLLQKTKTKFIINGVSKRCCKKCVNVSNFGKE